MKKSVFVISIVITSFSLMAVGFMPWNNSSSDYNKVVYNNSPTFELYYNVSNRWSTMTKEDLSKVKSIFDLFKEDLRYERDSFKNIRIDILLNDKDVRDVQTSAVGQNVSFSATQLNLLNSLDYSSNIRISALNNRKNVQTGEIIADSILLYMTVVPENEAEYAGGLETLVEYIKASSKEKVGIIKENKLQPGKVFFTVTDKGTIENVSVVATCGYSSVDKALVKIIKNMPERWTTASNFKGENVAQEFVFSFGMEGC